MITLPDCECSQAKNLPFCIRITLNVSLYHNTSTIYVNLFVDETKIIIIKHWPVAETDHFL